MNWWKRLREDAFWECAGDHALGLLLVIMVVCACGGFVGLVMLIALSL
jgi:hypothetical protein